MNLNVTAENRVTLFGWLKIWVAGAVCGLAIIGVFASFSTSVLGLASVGRFFTTPIVEGLVMLAGGLTGYLSSKS
jgi:hypothetical protein